MDSLQAVIRPATPDDIPAIMTVLDAAKGIMIATGNPHQWKDGYPFREIVASDIERSGGYVVVEAGAVVGYFAFFASPEPTYAAIEGGAWLDDVRPYHVIHRIGSFPEVHGVFRCILDWCRRQDANLRIDTHRDNRIMQHCIVSYGFHYCGIIHLANGDERLAYQLIYL